MKSGRKIKNTVSESKSVILYVVFGALTTLINFGVYYLLYDIIKFPNVLSTVIAWIISVAFAFITNKTRVFGSKSFKPSVLLYEIWAFVLARLLTGALDVGIMFLAVDVLKLNATLCKLVSNVTVIILNYFLSKLIVFKKKSDGENGEKN